MRNENIEKIIIVEGKTDQQQIEKVLKEEITILCTHGTFNVERFDELIDTYCLDDQNVYIFVDEDPPGMALRKELTRELPNAKHIYVSEEYGEVASTPTHIVAKILSSKDMDVHSIYLQI